MADNFKELENIFTMFTPIDLVGTVEPNLGGTLSQTDTAVAAFVKILENSGRGVANIETIISEITNLKSKSREGSPDVSQLLTIWTDKDCPNLGTGENTAKFAIGTDGQKISVNNMLQIIGADFKIPDSSYAKSNIKTSIIMSKSPFFNPAVRNTHLVEIFLNSMPSTVLSQLVPFMQVEFQSNRSSSGKLQGMSLLKFIQGAVDKSSANDANAAMYEAHQIPGNTKDDSIPELDYAGMEMFTAPQTLTNPQPNLSVGTNGTRYVDVLDPFRPFATLESVTINAKPSGHGFYTYKTANMAIKLHDRSRLNEIADLIRVNIFTGVTIWMTYGWRAPVRPGQNPYFDYVNNNLLMREAYHIQNSSFSFDAHGQVTINLQLWTTGISHMRSMKLSDQFGSMLYQEKLTKQMIEGISKYRRELNLDPPEGTNVEIRAYQVLNAAETTSFPIDMTPDEVKKQIAILDSSLNTRKDINKEAASSLIKSLNELYKKDGKEFYYNKKYKGSVNEAVEKMFNEVRTGPDPFLPHSQKNKGSKDYVGNELAKICDDQNSVSNKGTISQKKAVSFGKIFTTFMMRGILSMPPASVQEVQVFFYSLNDQCGPASNHSIAEFPIKMDDFISQFKELKIAKGAEDVMLEDFLELCVNAQFTDHRALGYGLNKYYKTWSQSKELQLIDGFTETSVAKEALKYGPFKQPQIEIHIEVSHERVSNTGQNDILTQLTFASQYSQPDLAQNVTKNFSSDVVPDGQSSACKKIMRIHVYDKQTNPNKSAALLLKNENNTGFIQHGDVTEKFAAALNTSPSKLISTVNGFLSVASSFVGASIPVGTPSISIDQITGNYKLSPFVNNQQIKNIVSKLVPTIKFGANGSTITTATVSSKAIPKVGTNNLINSQASRNTAAPNGRGDLGIPLRVIPAQLTMTTLGCPLACLAQNFFIDFNTGTTLDNLYILTHLSHNFTPGKFETNWTFGYSDGYGTFEGAQNIKAWAGMPSDVSKQK